jgi:hypothetical protein
MRRVTAAARMNLLAEFTTVPRTSEGGAVIEDWSFRLWWAFVGMSVLTRLIDWDAD